MKRTVNLINIIYWLLTFSFLAYFILIEVPKKGFNLSDHGDFMASANNIIHGAYNQFGLAALINATLIKLHFNYLSISRFFYLFQAFAALVFLGSLRLRAQFYWIAPLTISLIIAPNVVHVFSYETAAPFMLLMGIALLYFCLNYSLSKFWCHIIYALSAIFFVYSSVTNIIFTPSLLINAIILLFIYPKIRNKTFIITYMGASLIGLYCVLFKIFPLLTMAPYYHPGFIHQAFGRLFANFLRIAALVLSGFFGTKLIAWCFAKIYKKFKQDDPSLIQTSTLIFMTFILWIELRLYFHYYFISWKNSLFVYGLVYLGIILAIYGWRFYRNRTQSLLALALILQIEYYFAMVGGVDLAWNVRTLAAAGPITLIVLLWLEYFFLQDRKHLFQKIIITALLIWGSYFPMKQQFIYAFGHNPKDDTTKVTNIARLNGVLINPDFLKSVEQVVNAYKANHCENKLFITRQVFPMFYYIFDRLAYPPLYFTDSKSDLQRLEQQGTKKGYCFIGEYVFENHRYSKFRNPEIIAFRKLNRWLQAHSKKIMYIPIHGTCCIRNDYVMFYVG